MCTGSRGQFQKKEEQIQRYGGMRNTTHTKKLERKGVEVSQSQVTIPLQTSMDFILKAQQEASKDFKQWNNDENRFPS